MNIEQGAPTAKIAGGLAVVAPLTCPAPQIYQNAP